MSYKKWLLVTIFLFSVGLAFGLMPPKGFDDLFSENLVELEELAGILAPFTLTTLIFILIKNSLALILSFALSPFLCLVPILSLLVNGSVIGFVSVMVVEEESLGVLLAGILPHGIFEIPALIIGLAAALSFGTMVMQSMFSQERRAQLLPSFKRHFRYLLIALALLVPAAIIETFVTPLFLA